MEIHRGEANLECRHFNGYRPCAPGYVCDGCREADPFDRTILLINLDAMGDVLMTTCLLPALRRKHPRALLTWLTLPAHLPLLAGNPLIDRAWGFDLATVTTLEAMEFDLLLNADKGRPSCALATRLRAAEKRGFGLDRNGMIRPLHEDSRALYRLGLDDDEKFRKNGRTGQELLAEAFGLDYRRDPYVLRKSAEEERFVEEFRRSIGASASRPVIGIQTGTSDLYPLKSLTEDQVVALVGRLDARLPGAAILLLGGPGEAERNRSIARRCGGRAIETPVGEGLRRGLLYVDTCDAVVSPDSGALHIAIALGKWTVGWFNVSCAQEIDLFDRGVKVTTPLACSPCWRRACPDPICRTIVDLDAIVDGVAKGLPAAR
ncbi:MAG: glycosyltransferase family 9 protein [Candidatus Eisenbacteria bacterium]|nr:glycosyltransferase family 9 protein [Candidatus Eisenbacteria bacterium]